MRLGSSDDKASLHRWRGGRNIYHEHASEKFERVTWKWEEEGGWCDRIAAPVLQELRAGLF